MDDKQTTFLPAPSGRGRRRVWREELAVYRCETGEYGQVRIYFVGSKPEGLSGLLTINTET